MSGRVHSVSSVSSYEECPKAWEFNYLRRVKPEGLAPEHWRFGTVVHAGFEAAYTHARDEKLDIHSDEVWEVASARLRESWAEEQMPTHGGELDRALGILAKSLAEHPDLAPADILGVEHKLLHDTPDGTRVIGFADLIVRLGPESVGIEDHKITSRTKSAQDLQYDFQLNTYGWMVLREFPWAKTVYGTHHYPPVGKRVTVQLTREGMEEAVARMEATAEATELDDEYAPAPGEHCSSCQFKPQCPAWDRATNPSLGEVANF